MMEQLNTLLDLSRLFCTFTLPEELNETINTINRRYSVLFNKIFILESSQSNELMCTYNIDSGNSTEVPMANSN